MKTRTIYVVSLDGEQQFFGIKEKAQDYGLMLVKDELYMRDPTVTDTNSLPDDLEELLEEYDAQMNECGISFYFDEYEVDFND